MFVRRAGEYAKGGAQDQGGAFRAKACESEGHRKGRGVGGGDDADEMKAVVPVEKETQASEARWREEREKGYWRQAFRPLHSPRSFVR